MSPTPLRSEYWGIIHALAQRIADVGDRLNDMSGELDGDVSELILLALSSDALGLSARLGVFRIQYGPEEEADA